MHEYAAPQQEEEFGRPARQSSHVRQKRTGGGQNQGIGARRRNLSSVGARNNARAGSKQRTGQYGYQPPQQTKQTAQTVHTKQSGFYQFEPRSSNQPGGISTNVVNCLKEELLQTWEAYLIPDYHRTVFLDCIYGLLPQQYSPIIVKEIEDLQNEQAPI